MWLGSWGPWLCQRLFLVTTGYLLALLLLLPPSTCLAIGSLLAGAVALAGPQELARDGTRNGSHHRVPFAFGLRRLGCVSRES